MTPENDEILEIAKDRIGKDLPVAAICGATCGLARVGALNSKKHTSNDLDFLKYVAKDYTGADNYSSLPAVNDRNLITASGQAALMFTYEIIKALNLFNSITLEAWKNMNLTNEAKYYFEMMNSLENRNG
jgi:putative intracellular protease/amidase